MPMSRYISVNNGYDLFVTPVELLVTYSSSTSMRTAAVELLAELAIGGEVDPPFLVEARA